MSAADSLRIGALPIGLAHGVRLTRAAAQGQPLCWTDVASRENEEAVRVRREMERMYSTPEIAAALEH
jgi:predicted homoserine dehydrogenase-like protein